MMTHSIRTYMHADTSSMRQTDHLVDKHQKDRPTNNQLIKPYQSDGQTTNPYE